MNSGTAGGPPDRPRREAQRLRNIRVGDSLWNESRECAELRDTTVSEVVRRALARFVNDTHARYPKK